MKRKERRETMIYSKGRKEGGKKKKRRRERGKEEKKGKRVRG